MKRLSIEFLIFYSITVFLVLAILDKPLESQSLIAELLKILISGYLGYLIRAIQKSDNRDV